MKKRYLPIRILQKALKMLWNFPWIKACLVTCMIAFIGMSVMQRMEASQDLQSNIVETFQGEEKEANNIVLSAHAQDPDPDPAPADPPAAQPADPEADPESEASLQESLERIQEALSGGASIMAKIAVFFLKIVGALLMFMLYWMADLMDNTFILDGSMGDKLQTIWIFVRNIVNIIFAIVLVVVAFINVAGYGSGEGNYALKKFIPKMAIALIAVNFTFLGARIVLDVNNVLTTAVFALPDNVSDLSEFTAEGRKPLRMYAKWNCTLDKDKIQSDTRRANEAAGVDTAQVGGVEGDDVAVFTQGKPITNFFNVCVADIDGSITALGTDSTADPPGTVALDNLSELNRNNFVWIMATRYQGIQNIAKVPLEAKDWEALIENANFAIIFGIIYAVAYFAMFVILILRVVVLWITIALSPLIAVEILFPELMSGLSKIGEGGLKGMFLDHAFVPLKMAVPMSIGFIMISQMSLLGAGSFGGEITLTGGEFTRGGSFQRILYGIASVALIWAGVFSATSGVKGSEFIEKIKGGVEGIGKFAAKAPLQLAPIVPIAGNVPIASLVTAAKTIMDYPQQSAALAGRQLGASVLPGRDAERAAIAVRSMNTSTAHGTIQDHWQNLDSAGRKEALLKLSEIYQASIPEEVRTNLQNMNADEFMRSADWSQFMAGLQRGNANFNADDFSGTSGGAAQAPTITAGLAAFGAGIDTGENAINVKLGSFDDKLEISDSITLQNNQNINQEQLGQIMEHLGHRDDSAQAIATFLADNPEIQRALAQNSGALHALEHNTKKSAIARELLGVFRRTNNDLDVQQASALLDNLETLGANVPHEQRERFLGELQNGDGPRPASTN